MKPTDEPLTFNEYQNFTGTTAVYKGKDTTMGTEPHLFGLCYLGLKLGGEAGEVQEKIGKMIRDNGGQITPEFRLALKKELGDILWYISEIGNHLDISMEDIANTNKLKLQERKLRGVLHGSGDNR